MGTVLPLDFEARLESVRTSFDLEVRKLFEHIHRREGEMRDQGERKLEVMKAEAQKAKQELIAFRAY